MDIPAIVSFTFKTFASKGNCVFDDISDIGSYEISYAVFRGQVKLVRIFCMLVEAFLTG